MLKIIRMRDNWISWVGVSVTGMMVGVASSVDVGGGGVEVTVGIGISAGAGITPGAQAARLRASMAMIICVFMVCLLLQMMGAG